ncbi:MAG: hypothetical protein R6U44_04260 [Archaeoglobaceae archaeon]
MYELAPASSIEKISKARIYHSQINRLGQIIFEVIMRRDIDRRELEELVSNLPQILSFCEVDKGDEELVEAVTKELMENPAKVRSVDLNNTYEIINSCKAELRSYIREQTTERFVEIEREKFSHYVDELKNHVLGEIQVDKEKRKGEAFKLVYNSPGHYIKSIHTYLSRKYGEISYSAVRNYINELKEEKKIITIGGPQGKFRYCFPHPNIIEDKSFYYGRCFGIEGATEEPVSDKFRTPELSGPFFNIYVVNSNIKPVLLALPYGVSKLESDTSIKAYGEIEPYNYLENLGYLPDDNSLRLDVLFGWKVARVSDGEEIEVWLDENRATISPEI